MRCKNIGWVFFGIGILITIVSFVGYFLDIPPFHLHPDYSKDQCCGSNSTHDFCAINDKGFTCLRVNPEMNYIAISIGFFFVMLGDGFGLIREVEQ